MPFRVTRSPFIRLPAWPVAETGLADEPRLALALPRGPRTVVLAGAVLLGGGAAALGILSWKLWRRETAKKDDEED